MPRNRITTLVLQDPQGSCREDMKEDTEAMFIDPISKAGYIIQKVRPRNLNKSPVILKVFLVIIDFEPTMVMRIDLTKK